MKNFKLRRAAAIIGYTVLAVVVFSSCVNDAKESVQDGDFKIEFLFEHDGCKVYRFKDGGRYIYWSDCSGRMSSDYTQSNGKSTRTVRMESFTNNR